MSGKTWNRSEEDEVWMLIQEGYSFAEIGEKLDRTEGAVKTRFIRIKRRKHTQRILERARELNNGQRSSL